MFNRELILELDTFLYTNANLENASILFSTS